MTATELRQALTTLGLSQREAARRLGVPTSSIHRWLTGKRPIRGPVISAVTCWLRQAGHDTTIESGRNPTPAPRG